ncbi:hypothetical protein ACW0US_17825 [Xanthomonas euvesicatoria]
MASTAADESTGVTEKEWEAVNRIISERNSGFPPVVLAQLNRVRPALAKLVDNKVPFREINDSFAKLIPIKISSAQFRKYMREQFDYPPSNRAKKSTRSKAKKRAKSP